MGKKFQTLDSLIRTLTYVNSKKESTLLLIAILVHSKFRRLNRLLYTTAAVYFVQVIVPAADQPKSTYINGR